MFFDAGAEERPLKPRVCAGTGFFGLACDPNWWLSGPYVRLSDQRGVLLALGVSSSVFLMINLISGKRWTPPIWICTMMAESLVSTVISFWRSAHSAYLSCIFGVHFGD